MNRPHPAAVGLSGLAVVVLIELARAVGLGGSVVGVLETLAVLAVLYAIGVCVYPLTPRARVRATLGPGGWAGRRHLHAALSARAVQRVACEVRPSVRALPPPERAKLPKTDFGAYVGRTVVGPLRPWSLYCSYRDVVMMVAPPQTGKTALLGGMIIDAPGAVIAASTKGDIYKHTAALRAKRGPVLVFDPEGLTGLKGTFRWSPVTGCQVPAVAQERANYLVIGSNAAAGVSNGGFFEQQAAKVLRAYLLAAALDGRGMADVAAWAQAPTDRTALRILSRMADRVPVGWDRELAQILNTEAAKTRESIYLTLGLSTAFMTDPYVAKMCEPSDEEAAFDVKSFLEAKGTLYLLGSERPHGSVAPLLTCLTGYLFEEAKRVAAACEDGRLDPPLMLALDEAALITPVPLDRWSADSGGRGIQLIFAVQALAQLFQRWGERGGQTIVNNANLKVVYNGLTLAADLDALSKVCGEREYNGRLVRILPPDRLRQLPPFHVLALYRFTPPTIARITPVWKRPDVLAAKREAEAASAAAQPAAADAQPATTSGRAA